MLRKILFNFTVIMLISGITQSTNLFEEYHVQSHQLTLILKPTEGKNDLELKSTGSSKPVQDHDLSPHLDHDKFRFNGQISTEHGTFAWAEKQTVFNESEIARELNRVNDKTKQLMIPMFGSVYLRVDDDAGES
ncbi:hypothetical protein [Paenibacillus taichungensis]|uniref:hypothetical protein n=1 Tax=Paenibacillus taichungensis TaxID=484184 RepID=UPI0039A438F1